MINTPSIDKLAVDVLTTRRHWYPKWIIFRATLTLVRRSAYGEAAVAFDAAIDSGAAVPIPRNKEAICDAMTAIRIMYPHLEHHFLSMLSVVDRNSDGCRLFLEVAARQFLHASTNQETDASIIELWNLWYKHRLHKERHFFTALVRTETFVVNSLQALD